jgi:hypothetical protein
MEVTILSCLALPYATAGSTCLKLLVSLPELLRSRVNFLLEVFTGPQEEYWEGKGGPQRITRYHAQTS